MLKSVLPVVLEDEEVLIECFVDISERKKAEEEIRRAMQIRAEFTSVLSHELRTPLTAIREGIGTVLDGPAGDVKAEQASFLDTAKRNVGRLARLISDVLDYQRLDAGKMSCDVAENHLNPLAGEVAQSMRTLAEAKGCSCTPCSTHPCPLSGSIAIGWSRP